MVFMFQILIQIHTTTVHHNHICHYFFNHYQIVFIKRPFSDLTYPTSNHSFIHPNYSCGPAAAIVNQQNNSRTMADDNKQALPNPDQLVNIPPPPPDSPPHSPPTAALVSKNSRYRFEVTVLSLASLMFAVCVLQTLATSSYYIVRLIALPCALFLTFYGYEWTVYFSDGLTRRKRAYFNVMNVLETYQPRRNTDEARNFQPDPPTPNVKMAPPAGTQGQEGGASTAQNNDNQQQQFPPEGPQPEFREWRRKHYENEYVTATNLATQLSDIIQSDVGNNNQQNNGTAQNGNAAPADENDDAPAADEQGNGDPEQQQVNTAQEHADEGQQENVP